MDLIEEQLPDAVELMVRSLRVGHPFTSAISIVLQGNPGLACVEIGVNRDETAYGRDIGGGAQGYAERLDMQDTLPCVAVTIQQQIRR